MTRACFGRLIPVDRLGTGTFATVWRCEDPELGGEVAVKVLAENHAADDRTRSRFVEEAQLLRRTDGQGRIVAVHDVGRTDDDRPFMVMEFASGGTLEDRLPDEPLPPDAVAQLVEALHDCLRVLHANGIVHRDLKPSNLLVTAQPPAGDDGPVLRADERLVVGDLGLAKSMDSDWEGTVLGGTPAYMAPEQQARGRIDARADLYAAAAIVARAATGARPSPAVEGSEPTLDLPSSYPAAFGDALARAMSYDPDGRPDDAEGWAALLRDGLAGRTVRRARTARRPMPPAWLRPAWAAAVVAAVVVVVAAVVFRAGGGDQVLVLQGTATVGEPVRIVADADVDVSSWAVEPPEATSLDPEGPAGGEFTVRPVYPRLLTVVAVDSTGERHELVLAPGPSAAAPEISGPSTVTLLEPAEFSVAPPCDGVRWSVETSDGILQPRTGCTYGFNADRVGLVFVLASHVVDGVEVGTSVAVEITEG